MLWKNDGWTAVRLVLEEGAEREGAAARRVKAAPQSVSR